MNPKGKYIIGIDACKLGWVAVCIDQSQEFSISKHQTFSSIIYTYPNAEKYLVDMVIGLADKNHLREIEKLAREKLKPNRTSTVFTPPCREAVYEKNYDAAKKKNIAITGKSISIQAWNIVPKIREVDKFILKNKNLRSKINEAHPELCFASLNNGKPMQFKKSTKEGEDERLTLLSHFYPKSKSVFEEGSKSFLKKEVKNDDIIDALGLAVTGLLGMQNGFDFLISKNKKQDIHGLEMNMCFYKKNKSH